MRRELACLAVGLVVTASCGGPGGGDVAGSCTQVVTVGPVTTRTCTEWVGYTPDQLAPLRTGCSAALDGGLANLVSTFAAAACDRANRVGGCRATTGVASATSWYYAGGTVTEASVRAACSSSSAVFVAP